MGPRDGELPNAGAYMVGRLEQLLRGGRYRRGLGYTEFCDDLAGYGR